MQWLRLWVKEQPAPSKTFSYYTVQCLSVISLTIHQDFVNKSDLQPKKQRCNTINAKCSKLILLENFADVSVRKLILAKWSVVTAKLEERLNKAAT